MLQSEIKQKIKELEELIRENKEQLIEYKAMLAGEDLRDRNVLARRVLEEVSIDYWIEKEGIIGKCRKKEFMGPRREYVKRLHKLWYTLQRIADYVWRSHVDIIYLLKN